MTHAPLKDSLNKNSISHIADNIGRSYKPFKQKKFIDAAIDGLDSLELKQRIHHIIDALHAHLPKDFSKTAKILDKTARQWGGDNSKHSYSVFAAWAVTDYVSIHGIDQPELALPLLKQLTPLFSAEFAIRPFIELHPALTWKFLHEWADDEYDQVRRLASEGCRPRLPWGSQLKELIKDPAPILPLLNKLSSDSSDYVRRSVANNLNDIAKDHSQLVIDICSDWNKGATKETQWIIRHATRTLVKQGHPKIFQLLGYTDKPKLELKKLKLNKNTICLGENLEFSFELISQTTKTQKLVVDYAIHYQKANGKTSKKVYKLKNLQLEGNSRQTITKNQAFKPISTRSFYPGKHRLEILINGISAGAADFKLQV